MSLATFIVVLQQNVSKAEHHNTWVALVNFQRIQRFPHKLLRTLYVLSPRSRMFARLNNICMTVVDFQNSQGFHTHFSGWMSHCLTTWPPDMCNWSSPEQPKSWKDCVLCFWHFRLFHPLHGEVLMNCWHVFQPIIPKTLTLCVHT